MKYLLNSSNQPIRKGAYVSATSENEMVLDSENFDNILRKTLEQIAICNKITNTKALNKAQIVKAISAEFDKQSLPEVNTMPVTEQIQEIIKSGFEAGKEDEQMLVEIIQAGVKYKEAGKLFAQISEELGLRVSNKVKKEKVWQLLDDAEFKPEAYAEVEKAAAYMSEKVPETDNTLAMQFIRSWAKKNEIELPKKQKESENFIMGTGSRGKILTWLYNNLDCTKEQLQAFIREARGEMTDEKIIISSTERFYSYLEFHRLAVDASNEAQTAQEEAA